MEQSGYDANFVDDLPDYLTCAICHLALRNPVHLVDCGHRFCSTCYEKMKEHTAQTNTDLLCPHDRIKVEYNKVFEDKGISRVILDLHVKCNFYPDGCQWTGELRNLEIHIQRDCSYGEKERTSALLKELCERLDTYEVRLEEKEKEIAIMKEHAIQFEERVLSLQKQFDEYEKQKTTASASCLKSSDSTTKFGTSSEIKNINKQLQNSFTLKDLQSYPGASHKTPSNDNGKFDNLDKQIKSLQQDVAAIKQKQQQEIKHVEVIDQLISNREIVFKWVLKDYNHHRQLGDDVYSPQFYSGVNGHCCQLIIEWGGNRKGRIGLFFKFYHGIYDHMLTGPPKMGITLECVSKNGQKEIHEFFSSEFAEDYGNYKVVGLGKPEFLNMPRLRDFIIDDSLSITCVMKPE